MLGIRIKVERVQTNRQWHGLPPFRWRVLLFLIFSSLFIHLGSYWKLSHLSRGQELTNRLLQSNNFTKITIKEPQEKEKDESKKILETPQLETKAPEDARFLGAQDHQTDKETRTRLDPKNRLLAQDPGVKNGSSNPSQPSAPSLERKSSDSPPENPAKTSPFSAKGPGSLGFGPTDPKARNAYEKLLPKMDHQVASLPDGGFQDSIDAEAEYGERVDMNTTNFKFISYFTGFRKAIELVWIYPSDAIRRGLQGEVQLEMVIEKDGRLSRVKILRSSGHAALDENILQTVRLASPFAPLPKPWGKERLVVVGSFRYILTAYAGASY